MVLSLPGACGGLTRSIVIDREVLLQDVALQTRALSRTRAGGFILAGGILTAQAVMTNESGTILWQYSAPRDNQIDLRDQSQFEGVVQLANGDLLFCGTQATRGRHRVNLVAVLDAESGSAKQFGSRVPNDNPSLTSSGFHQCLYREGGISLIGYAYADGQARGFYWIVKLDANGNKLEELLAPLVIPTDSVELADHSLVTQALDESRWELQVSRVRVNGAELARRVIPKCTDGLLLRPMTPSNMSRLIARGSGIEGTLYTLDENLSDAKPPKRIDDFDLQRGIGYVLPDGSLALFGRTSNAAIAWMSPSGSRWSSYTFGAEHISFVVDAALPLSATEILTVRGSNSADPSERGTIISWVTFKHAGH